MRRYMRAFNQSGDSIGLADRARSVARTRPPLTFSAACGQPGGAQGVHGRVRRTQEDGRVQALGRGRRPDRTAEGAAFPGEGPTRAVYRRALESYGVTPPG